MSKGGGRRQSAPVSSYARWAPGVDEKMRGALGKAADNLGASQDYASLMFDNDYVNRLKASRQVQQNPDGTVVVGSNVDPLTGQKRNAFSGAGATADEIGLDTKNYMGQGLGDFIKQNFGKEDYHAGSEKIKTAYGDIDNPLYTAPEDMPDRFQQKRIGGRNKHGIYENYKYDYTTDKWVPIGRKEGQWDNSTLIGPGHGSKGGGLLKKLLPPVPGLR